MRSDQETRQERCLRDAVLAGDETAWGLLYERSFQPLFAFVGCRLRGRPEDTAEVVQESWMIAVRRIRDFDPTRSSFETWVRGIALNVLRNLLRSEERRRRTERSGSRVEESTSDRSGIVERIARALTLLPSRYQEILRAKYHENLPVAAIAASLGQSPKAVESMLSRARVAFRAAYSRLERGEEVT